MDVKTPLHTALTQLPSSCQHILVGYSGGLDSAVLLHALVQLLPQHPTKRITAVHVHHGLSPHADAWLAHCAAQATVLGVAYKAIHVQAKPTAGESPEAAARTARYAAFTELMTADSVLMLAHHQDDQAETVLLQLLRGAGVAGLAAMPALTSFASGWLQRPLLHLTRKALHAYAIDQALAWVDDESNDNHAFDRNYIRHHIMPLLTARWPAAAACIARSAGHCAEAHQLTRELAALDSGAAVIPVSSLCSAQRNAGIQLPISTLLTLDPPRQRNVIRHWLQTNDFPLPSTNKLDQILQTMLHSRHDATPLVTWSGVEVRRYQQHLYVMSPLPPHDPSWQHVWDVQNDLVLPANIGVLKANDYRALAAGSPLTIQFRQGGEKVKRLGHAHHHCLKNLLQQAGIPPWLRDRIPLIFLNGVLMNGGLRATR